ncbi:MAG TPA: ABC transporter ATP-binding protein [Myxococcales bacterium]|nr:ABC transporter ATP-binding protein [Myxococcales bacterium]
MNPAVAARGMARRFGAVQALSGLTFEVAEGSLFGMVGPDGAGKTTAIRALAGLIDLDEGEARVLGRPPSEARESIGLLPQQYSLYRDLTVGENLRFFARLYLLPREVHARRARRLLEATGLAPFEDRRAEALSGGMYKKLALACALLHEPRVLLLDEPTSGVDPLSRRELWTLLREFARGGMAVVLSTPYMDEAERCTHVGLMHEGRLLLSGEPRALLADVRADVCEVDGAPRPQIENALAGVAEVWSSAPAGSRLRLLLAPGAAAQVAATLRPIGAALRPVAPRFEDLFIARLREAA